MLPLARLVIPCLSAFVFAHGSLALTIDDFEEGDFQVIASLPVGENQSQQTGIGVVGGTRQVRTVAFGTAPARTATASLTTTPADDAAVLSATDQGAVIFSYDGIPNGIIDTNSGTLALDLSSFDAIRIQMTAAGVDGTLRLTMWDDSTSAIGSLHALVNGNLDIPLAAYAGLDLGDIRALSLRIDLLGPAAPSMLLGGILAVPEPGSAWLLSLGLIALAARTRLNA